MQLRGTSAEREYKEKIRENLIILIKKKAAGRNNNIPGSGS
jgi:hypothetical protein